MLSQWKFFITQPWRIHPNHSYSNDSQLICQIMYGVRGVDLRSHAPKNRKSPSISKEEMPTCLLEEETWGSEESCCSRMFSTTFKCYESEVSPIIFLIYNLSPIFKIKLHLFLFLDETILRISQAQLERTRPGSISYSCDISSNRFGLFPNFWL